MFIGANVTDITLRTVLKLHNPARAMHLFAFAIGINQLAANPFRFREPVISHEVGKLIQRNRIVDFKARAR